MEITLLEQAVDDLGGMDNNTWLVFAKHLRKIAQMPPRRHLKYGVPVHVEDVGQGRIVYQINEDELNVIRLFADHKDYERWYKSNF